MQLPVAIHAEAGELVKIALEGSNSSWMACSWALR
jgi:hypothetical protein